MVPWYVGVACIMCAVVCWRFIYNVHVRAVVCWRFIINVWWFILYNMCGGMLVVQLYNVCGGVLAVHA